MKILKQEILIDDIKFLKKKLIDHIFLNPHQFPQKIDLLNIDNLAELFGWHLQTTKTGTINKLIIAKNVHFHNFPIPQKIFLQISSECFTPGSYLIIEENGEYYGLIIQDSLGWLKTRIRFHLTEDKEIWNMS